MRKLLFSGWNAMKWVRMGLAGVILAEGIIHYDWLSVLLGAGFAALTLLNIGCCGACDSGGCGLSYRRDPGKPEG